MSNYCCNSSDYMTWCFKWLCDEDTPAKTFCDVGYFYDTQKNSQYTPLQPINFTATPPIVRGGITLAPTTQINIANTGLYEVLYVALKQDNSASSIQLKLYNGSTDPTGTLLPQTIYGNVQDKTVYGQAFIEVATPDSKLELISVDGIKLNKGGLPNVITVSLTIKKICDE